MFHHQQNTDKSFQTAQFLSTQLFQLIGYFSHLRSSNILCILLLNSFHLCSTRTGDQAKQSCPCACLLSAHNNYGSMDE
jgi:hypothetical protein